MSNDSNSTAAPHQSGDDGNPTPIFFIFVSCVLGGSFETENIIGLVNASVKPIHLALLATEAAFSEAILLDMIKRRVCRPGAVCMKLQ